ncbi:MAG: OprO/OprP family phosphate-selective porin [Nitrospira sp.]|nr:OprO/OprP family phosphate-selective porin [Nitrospira sp.]MDH4302922.1 OprO/OprP family phosphate-selective porin [Nitrospira sp.]MDH5195439.1 OprO/OprP family phosphate-selective porin [Nitrospira sp.]
MRGLWLAMIMGGVGLGLVFGASSAQAAHDLADILYEKGQITKEEWVRAKADSEKIEEEQRKKREQEFPLLMGYKDGFDLQTRDGKFEMLIQNRLQFRYSYPQESDTFSNALPEAFNDQDTSSFRIRRARIKVGGHGFVPWLKYYVEYDWVSNTLLDYRLDVAKFRWATLRVGQWKIDYNRERVDSSGNQQFVERSIVNAPFTLDRQIGARLGGHLFEDTYAYLVYNIGVFTGVGINQTHNDDKNMLYMGRIQWNFLGRDVPFSQSDPDYTQLPIGSIAFAGAHNITDRIAFPQTSRASDFLGVAVVDGRFEVNQGVQEFAFKWNGLSIQEEFHVKKVIDRSRSSDGTSYGAYAQVGYFPHALIDVVPKPLEFAYRYAFLDPGDGPLGSLLGNQMRREHTFGVNWFFAGHRNKLSLDYSHLSRDGGFTPVDRVRLQWDVSF